MLVVIANKQFNQRTEKLRSGVMRLYLIPYALRTRSYLMIEFKEWCLKKNYDISNDSNFSIKKPNGVVGRSFKNDKCNRNFLSICRDFLINEKGHKMIGCNKR